MEGRDERNVSVPGDCPALGRGMGSGGFLQRHGQLSSFNGPLSWTARLPAYPAADCPLSVGDTVRLESQSSLSL